MSCGMSCFFALFCVGLSLGCSINYVIDVWYIIRRAMTGVEAMGGLFIYVENKQLLLCVGQHT
jgi:hypothetical protein